MEVEMSWFVATIWSCKSLSTAEKTATSLAIVIGIGSVPLALTGIHYVNTRFIQPGWSRDETTKGGLSCRPDPKSALGR